MVTPTFAAGLGVVLGAVLSYPLATRSEFRYQTPSGQVCRASGCGVSRQANVPAPPWARPGLGLPTSTPTTLSPQATVPGTGDTPSPSPAGQHGVRAVVEYQILSQVQQGFFASLTVTRGAGADLQSWRLRISYPSARVINVWGGRVLAHGRHSIVVGPSGAGSSSGGGRSVSIMIEVTGRAGPPARCLLDGQPATVVVS